MRQFLLYYTSQFKIKYAHLADKEDPSVFNVPKTDSQEMTAMLRFTSLQLDGSVLRQKNQRETEDAVQAFLQLRPDGYAINPKSKQIFLLEFTRAMDTDPHWEEYKDAEIAWKAVGAKRKLHAWVLLLSLALSRALSPPPPPPLSLSLSLSLSFFLLT